MYYYKTYEELQEWKKLRQEFRQETTVEVLEAFPRFVKAQSELVDTMINNKIKELNR